MPCQNSHFYSILFCLYQFFDYLSKPSPLNIKRDKLCPKLSNFLYLPMKSFLFWLNVCMTKQIYKTVLRSFLYF